MSETLNICWTFDFMSRHLYFLDTDDLLRAVAISGVMQAWLKTLSAAEPAFYHLNRWSLQVLRRLTARSGVLIVIAS